MISLEAEPTYNPIGHTRHANRDMHTQPARQTKFVKWIHAQTHTQTNERTCAWTHEGTDVQANKCINKRGNEKLNRFIISNLRKHKQTEACTNKRSGARARK